jgi:hypothetical protein
MSDPTWETRSEGQGEGPPPGTARRRPDDASGDDWSWGDIDWFEETTEPSSGPDVAETQAGQRIGLIPGAGGDAAGPSVPAGRLAAIRRRRIAALAVLGLLFACALIIPLVVFGGGGNEAAEQTTALTTTPIRTATAARTTTQERQATTTTAPSTSSEKTLHVTLPEGTTLNRGDRGSSVTALQKGLAALGFATGEPDGVFGAITEAAVVDFQQSNNLQPDGVVGSDTVRLLNAALARKGVTE